MTDASVTAWLGAMSDAAPLDREELGRLVRTTWVKWAREQPSPKPSWLLPWGCLNEPDREVDRRIGEAVAARVREHDARASRREDAARRAAHATCEACPAIAAHVSDLRDIADWMAREGHREPADGIRSRADRIEATNRPAHAEPIRDLIGRSSFGDPSEPTHDELAAAMAQLPPLDDEDQQQ